MGLEIDRIDTKSTVAFINENYFGGKVSNIDSFDIFLGFHTASETLFYSITINNLNYTMQGVEILYENRGMINRFISIITSIN